MGVKIESVLPRSSQVSPSLACSNRDLHMPIDAAAGGNEAQAVLRGHPRDLGGTIVSIDRSNPGERFACLVTQHHHPCSGRQFDCIN